MATYIVTRGTWGIYFWGVASYGAHCTTVAAVGAGGCIYMVLIAMTYLLDCTSALKGAISYHMALIPVFIDWVFVLLVICIMIIASVMIVMLSSLLSNNSCAFVIVPGIFTPLPRINIFTYASHQGLPLLRQQPQLHTLG